MTSLDPKEVWSDAYYNALEDGATPDQAEEIANRALEDYMDQAASDAEYLAHEGSRPGQFHKRHRGKFANFHRTADGRFAKHEDRMTPEWEIEQGRGGGPDEWTLYHDSSPVAVGAYDWHAQTIHDRAKPGEWVRVWTPGSVETYPLDELPDAFSESMIDNYDLAWDWIKDHDPTSDYTPNDVWTDTFNDLIKQAIKNFAIPNKKDFTDWCWEHYEPEDY